MRIAIVSDIHGNLEAWKSVLADIQMTRIEKTICLGNIVGYGPDPIDTLKSVHRHVNHFVLGNHDAVIAGLISPEHFNAKARTLIQWTKKKLGSQAKKFFIKFPLKIESPQVTFAHGHLNRPETFPYLVDKNDALDCWSRADSRIIFVGHTHKARIHSLSNTAHYRRFTFSDKQKVILKKNYRYIFNVGSVGLSRDGDARSSYLIYDSEANTVEIKRVAYDFETYSKKVTSTFKGICDTDFILHQFKKVDKDPVRKKHDFDPSRVSLLKPVAENQSIELKREVRKWKFATLATVFLCLVISYLSYQVWATQAKEVYVSGPERNPLYIEVSKDFLDPGDWEGLGPPTGWSYRLGHGQKQEVQLTKGKLTLDSKAMSIVEVSLPWLKVSPTRRLIIQIEGQREKGWHGELPLLIIDTMHRDGSVKKRFSSQNLVLRENKISKKHTPPISQHVVAIRIRFKGEFIGKIALTHLSATVKK